MIKRIDFPRTAIFTFTAMLLTNGISPQDQSPLHLMRTEGTANGIASSGPTHGTVNIFLANKNGLVAVTDSRLSNSNSFVDSGQKLFKIDNRTICTIAGWFSDPGPVIRADADSGPGLPAYLAVPQIMNKFISETTPYFANLERTADVLGVEFMSALKAAAEIDKYAGIQPNHSESQITIAGFDDNQELHILQRNIVPIIDNGSIVDYRGVRLPTLTLNGTSGMISVIRGIPTTAQSILNGSHHLLSSDAILGYLKDSLAKDNGASLSLHDMEQIAKQIARVTAQEHSNEVGGPLQIAKLAAGKVASFEQPITVTYPVPTSIVDGRFEGASGKNVGQGFQNDSHNFILLLKGVTLINSGQKLDNAFIFGSTIDGCALTYGGSPNSILDKSNTVTNSTLTLLPGADADSQFIMQIKIDFPSLRIIDQQRPHTGHQ
jgi:hypothetical protein